MLQDILRQKFREALAKQEMQLAQQRLADENTRFYRGQEFQAGENQKGRDFTAGQNQLGRDFTHGENVAGREFTAGENQKGRDFTHGENLIGRGFTAAQNEASRAFTHGENDLNRQNAVKVANLRVAGNPQATLSPEGLNLAAGLLAQGGGMLPLGMNAGGLRTQIINKAATMTDPNNLAGAQAGYQANKGSLVQLQRNRDSIKSFEQTAQKNMGVLEGTMKQLTDTGSPLLNQPIRVLEQKYAGDPTVAKFAAARRVVVNEVAKITSNPGLSGVLTNEARKEADDLIQGNMTIPQMMGVLQILRQDMGNRIGSFDTQIQEIQGRFGGGASQPTQGNGRVYYDANGNPIKR